MNRIVKCLMACLIGNVLFVAPVWAQPQAVHPEIGKPFPQFDVKKVKYYEKKQLTLADLKGKHAILDFWSSGCGSCITAFPKMNALKKKYPESLQVLLVAPEEKRRDIEAFYEVYRKKYHLELPAAFDSVFFNRVVPKYVPHLIWIDPQGIVQAITSTTDVTEENVEKFLRGKPFPFTNYSYAALQARDQKPKLDLSVPVGVSDTNLSKFLFRSWIQTWDKDDGDAYPNSVENYFRQYKKPQYQAVKHSIKQLYEVAYYDAAYNTSGMFKDTTTYWKPVVQARDSAMFAYAYPGQPYYNYFVELPGKTPNADQIRRIMQRDLEDYFGYKAEMTTREMRCLKLVVLDKDKIERIKATPGGRYMNQWKDESTENFFKNALLKDVVRTLAYKMDGADMNLAFDETGITEPVNLTIHAHIWDYDGIRKSLNKQGLELIWSTKPMKVLMISDPEPTEVDLNN